MKHTLSPEARERIANAQRARWEARKRMTPEEILKQKIQEIDETLKHCEASGSSACILLNAEHLGRKTRVHYIDLGEPSKVRSTPWWKRGKAGRKGCKQFERFFAAHCAVWADELAACNIS